MVELVCLGVEGSLDPACLLNMWAWVWLRELEGEPIGTYREVFIKRSRVPTDCDQTNSLTLLRYYQQEAMLESPSVRANSD